MNKPLITILSPCYNVEEYLPQCINSIINQTYDNLQIVLIDDGSKDNTWKIMQHYAKTDKRIEIYHQENQGVASTRNNLLDKVKGDYVLFIDSDDWCELDMVEFMLHKAISQKADIVTCSEVNNNGSFNKKTYIEETWNQPKSIFEFLRHIAINGSLCNKLIKVNLLHNQRFHSKISYGEDALFIWNLLQHTNKIIYTTKILYHYRTNYNSISHTSYDYKKISGHLVWKKISADTKIYWPQYYNIAKANFAISDMWQLYFAAKSNYKKDKHIEEFQKNLRNHLFIIYISGLINVKKMIFATIAAFSYSACKKLI